MKKLELKEHTTSEESTVTPFLALRLNYIIDGKPCGMRQLCRLMDNKIASTHMCSLEKGRRPSLHELKTYHEYFGVSYEYLLGETSSPSIKHDSFYHLAHWLGTSKKKDEKNMWATFLDLTTKEDGLVLLYYLSQYLKDNNMDDVEFANLLKEWKNLPEREFLSYQQIRMQLDAKQKDNKCGETVTK